MNLNRPPDSKMSKNPLLCGADQNSFLEEFAHSRLLVAPPAPPPVVAKDIGHVSGLAKIVRAPESKDLPPPPKSIQGELVQPGSTEQTFTDIPLTPKTNALSSIPTIPVAASNPIVGPPLVAGPPPLTGFTRSAPHSRYIPSNFIQTSNTNPAPLPVFQGTPSTPLGVSLFNPVQQEPEVSEGSLAGSVKDSITSNLGGFQPPSQPSPTAIDNTAQAPTGHLPGPIGPPPNANEIPLQSNAQESLSHQPTQEPSVQPPLQGFSAETNSPLASAPHLEISSANFQPAPSNLIYGQQNINPQIPTFNNPTVQPQSQFEPGSVPTASLFTGPNQVNSQNNFPPPNAYNASNENAFAAGLVPQPIVSSSSPFSSKNSSPPLGSQTPALISAERGSPYKPQPSPVNPQFVPTPNPTPISLTPVPPKSNSPALAGPPPVGPPPRGNPSAYPSALSRSLNRSALGQHSSSSLRYSPSSKPINEQVQVYNPLPVSDTPAALDAPQPVNFLTQSSQPAEAPKSSNFLSSAASFFHLGGSNTSSETQQVNTHAVPPAVSQNDGVSAIPSPYQTFDTNAPQLPNQYPGSVPQYPSAVNYFNPYPQPTQTPTNTPVAPEQTPVYPQSAVQQTYQYPVAHSGSRPSSVGSISSVQSSSSCPPVSSPFPHSVPKGPPPSNYFTPISQPDNSESSSTSSVTQPSSTTALSAPALHQEAYQQQIPPSVHPQPQAQAFSSASVLPPSQVQAFSSASVLPQSQAQAFSSASTFFSTPPSSQSLSNSFIPGHVSQPIHPPSESFGGLSDQPNLPIQAATAPQTSPSANLPIEPSGNVEASAGHDNTDQLGNAPPVQLTKPPNAPPPTNLGNSYRRASLTRHSYAPVPDLEVSKAPQQLKMQPHSETVAAENITPNQSEASLNVEREVAHSNLQPTNESSVSSMEVQEGGHSAEHYTPVTHHWFYKKGAKRTIWHPFSTADSILLEQAFNSPDLNENTKVPTDGGRYDVLVLQRKKIAVYWCENYMEVRRCSWFVKSLLESRYVPYDENIAEYLEEEYKQGCFTNEWDRRIELSEGEMVILQSRTSMIHHQRHSSIDDGFGSPNSTLKYRTVKRSFDDIGTTDEEPTKIDHLVLVVHGIGKVCDLRFRSLVDVVEDSRSVSLQLVQSHFKQATETGEVGRVEFLPVEWHQALHTEAINKRLSDITLPSISKAREFTNDTILDVLFYSSPKFSEKIVQAVGAELNKTYNLFMQRNPHFKGGVSLVGHSLGSLILFDMLSNQKEVGNPTQCQPEPSIENEVAGNAGNINAQLMKRMSYLSIGTQGAGQTVINCPNLDFKPTAFFALGSPIGMFLTVRGIERLGEDYKFPTCPRFFNIFHPNDPVAYRIEALISNEMATVPPVLIPHHKGRKRMHLELKDTMTHITTALKQKLVESVRSTLTSVYQLAMFQRADKSLHREVDQALEEEVLRAPDLELSPPSPAPSSTHSISEDQALNYKVGSLNQGNRIDYVLQEAPLETFNQYLSAVRGHLVYWDSEDTMLVVLKEIYAAMDIKPDSQVPQQILPFDINSEDHYSEFTDNASAQPSAFVRK